MHPSFSVTGCLPRGGDGARDLGVRDNPSVPVGAANPYRRQASRLGVAVRSGRQGWLWGLLAAAVGAGAVARFPLGSAQDGLLFATVYGLGLLVLAFPLLLAEGALGQLRRRDPEAAYGSGAWPAASGFTALVALAAAALVAYLGGLALRYAIASFEGTYFDDPGRTFRVAAQGYDALLLTFVVLVVAFGVARTGSGARPLLTAAGIVAVVATLALATGGLLQGATARASALAFPWRDLDAPLVVAALQQALLPALVGFGVVATWSANIQDRRLPQAAAQLLLLVLATSMAVGVGLAAFAADEGVALDGGFDAAFTSAAALFGTLGGTTGGVLAGLFYGTLALGALAATVALLDVPAAWVMERSGAWSPTLAVAASALVAYLLSAPLAFVASLPEDLHLILRAIVAPVGGLLVSFYAGWSRPQALGGYTFGDANHPLEATLRPMLRYVLPLLLLALLVLGVAETLAETGAVARGSGGLWRLVP